MSREGACRDHTSSGSCKTNNQAAIQDWVERVRKGEVRALARAISAIEDGAPESTGLLKSLFAHSGKARVIGLTGAPGGGKSTLVDQLAREYRKHEKTIGIVAV